MAKATVGPRDGIAVAVAVGTAVGVGCGVGARVGVGTGVWVGAGVAVAVGTGVGLAVCVGDAVGAGVAVGNAVRVAVGADVAVGRGVTVEVGVAVPVGVGVTGGGVQMEGVSEIRPLDWVEFSRDLRLARRQTDDIHVFSLEGCVQQGFLERLRTFDWDGPVTLPLDQARKTNVVRKGLQGVLWVSAHPLLVLAGLFGLKWLISRLIRGKK